MQEGSANPDVSDGNYRDLVRRLNELERTVRLSAITIPAELEACQTLHLLLSPTKAMPPAGGWAASYQTILFIVSKILESPTPLNILEFGGGTSSIWIGLALRESGMGHLLSFDQDSLFRQMTLDTIERHELGSVIDSVLAPVLKSDSDRTEWYDTEIVRDNLTSSDFVFIDGPYSPTDRLVRQPALEVIWSSISNGALILLDDIDRPGEESVMSGWIDMYKSRLIRLPNVSRTGILMKIPDSMSNSN